MSSTEKNIAKKQEIIKFYGGICECCKIDDIRLLSIDHIDGGGRKHRKELGISAGTQFYWWLKKNNFPQGFRVLCHNCNCSLGHNGYCPHKEIRNIDISMKFINNGLYTHTNKDGRICRTCGTTLTDDNWYMARKKNGKNICKKCDCLTSRKQVLKLKSQVILAYGKSCIDCGENKSEFLTIDHINNDGMLDRKTIGFGKKFYIYLIKNNFPKDNYQLMCYNCNSYKEYITRRGGI